MDFPPRVYVEVRDSEFLSKLIQNQKFTHLQPGLFRLVILHQSHLAVDPLSISCGQILLDSDLPNLYKSVRKKDKQK